MPYFDGSPKPTTPPDPGLWNGWLTEHSKQFDAGVNSLKEDLGKALEALGSDPSNATYLAQYQELLSQYNLYRMLQSNSVKGFKDTLSSNARNVG